MPRTIAGKSVHPVGLGCMNVSWAYGTPPGHDESVALAQQALDLGYDHFDTAQIYGMGQNEALLAEALEGRRDEVFLPARPASSSTGRGAGSIAVPSTSPADIDKSLALLGTDFIDLYYLHRFDPKVPIADLVGALARAIEAGKIGAYGVSEWSSAHVREAHAVHPLGAVQTEYSLWTRNVELACSRLARISASPSSPSARSAAARYAEC